MSQLRRCLVTGGAGFIGSHIVDALRERQHAVAVLDDLSSGKRHFIPSEVEFFEQSITADLDAAFESFKPQVVFHEAAHISVSVSVRDPIMDAERNILGSINVLEAAVRHGVERLVYASSGAAYGDPVTLPMDETHTVDALSPYGISKATVERYLYYYRAAQGLESVALRYSNVYGPRQDPHGEAGVVAIFSEKFLAGERPRVFGDGLQTRDFVFVRDVASANMAAMEADLGPDTPRVFNVSTQTQTTVNDLHQMLAEPFGFEEAPIHTEQRLGDVYHSVLANRSIAEHLGWSPGMDIRPGLVETAEYFRAGGTKHR